MMMQQIQQLQKTVRELQAGAPPAPPGTEGPSGEFVPGLAGLPGTQGMSNYRTATTWSNGSQYTRAPEDEAISEEDQSVLLVSNIPHNLANPDSVFYAFEKFGTVQRVKILHNKRNTALVQMSEPAEAKRAIQEQEKLNRVGTDIYVNFSSKFKEIRIPEPGSLYDDGLTKDFTGQFTSLATAPPPPPSQFGGYSRGGIHSSEGMFPSHPPRMGMGRGTNGYNYGDVESFGGMGGRGPGGGGVVLLVSNIPEQIANADNIFNMVGMYGDVMALKILRNKRDCCLVQMAKAHHAQQVRQFLDQAKVGGNKLCVSFSHVDNLLNKKIPEDDELQKDFLNSRNHRYRNHAMAAKLTAKLMPPTQTLHIANLPDGFGHADIKEMFIEKGFTVKESTECGQSGNMAILNMASPDEALLALAVMHNYAPPELKVRLLGQFWFLINYFIFQFKNAAGLCVSFSSKK